MPFRIDWNKPSTYGTTRAGPPPLWLLLAVIAALALIVLLAQGR